MTIEIDVEKRRGDRVIAARFAAGPGLTALFGPSGAGKTSILDMVAGLLRPDRGHIRIGERTLFDAATDLPPEARRIGYVFQDGRLFPHRRVMLLIPPIPMKARTLVIVYGSIELLMGITGTRSGVAHFAHLGGMLFGWLLIQQWRGRPPFGPRLRPRGNVRRF